MVLLWGGLVGLDATSFPQAMYSRPVVAGTVVGLLFGRPAEGAFMGLILELFALPVLPFGAAAYPETGTAAVAATSAYLAVAPARDDALLAAAVVLALLLSHVGGRSVMLMRVRNGRMAARIRTVTRGAPSRQHGPLAGGAPRADTVTAVEADARALETGHRIALALDFARAVLLTGIGLAVSCLALRALGAANWQLAVRPVDLTFMAAGAVAGAAVWIFGAPRQRLGALALGAGLGAALLVVT